MTKEGERWRQLRNFFVLCVFILLGVFLSSALMPLSAGLFVCQGVFSIDMPDFHARESDRKKAMPYQFNVRGTIWNRLEFDAP